MVENGREIRYQIPDTRDHRPQKEKTLSLLANKKHTRIIFINKNKWILYRYKAAHSRNQITSKIKDYTYIKCTAVTKFNRICPAHLRNLKHASYASCKYN